MAVFPSKEHHRLLAELIRDHGLGYLSSDQRFEWVAYDYAWNLERGRSGSPIDPEGEYRDPSLVKAARALYAKRAAPALPPDDYGWASPGDRARFERQERERREFMALFMDPEEQQRCAEAGIQSQFDQDYIELCRSQVAENIARPRALPQASLAEAFGVTAAEELPPLPGEE